MGAAIHNIQELYNTYRFGSFNYGRKREKFYPVLKEVITKMAPASCLYDVGCGAGFWFSFYEAHGIKKENITGVDLSPDNCRNLAEQGYRMLCGNILSLTLLDNISDITISTGVIHHTPNPLQAFKELVRITKPGGVIYVAVYNAWHPYYYIVHKAPFLLRWLYWRGNTKIVSFFYHLSKILFQPLALLVMGKFLDEKSSRTLFMDQVITPYAHLFTKQKLIRYARTCNVKPQKLKYCQYGLMIEGFFEVP